MKNNLTIILFVIATAFLSSCGTETENNANEIITTVSVAEFEKLINEKVGVLVDVRTPGEFQAGNIEGSTLMNVNGSDFNTKIETLDKNIPVLVYCRSGKRSMTAARNMKSKGFTKIYNLDGGFNAWSSKH